MPKKKRASYVLVNKAEMPANRKARRTVRKLTGVLMPVMFRPYHKDAPRVETSADIVERMLSSLAGEAPRNENNV